MTGNDDGWQVAAELAAAGVTVMGVADVRADTDSDLSNQVERMGIPAFWRHSIIKANGGQAVSSAAIAPVEADGLINANAVKEIDCDLISVSVGWAPDNGLLYQAGSKIEFDADRHEFLPTAYPGQVFAAGRITGPIRWRSASKRVSWPASRRWPPSARAAIRPKQSSKRWPMPKRPSRSAATRSWRSRAMESALSTGMKM